MTIGPRRSLAGGSAFARPYDDGHGPRRAAVVFEAEGHAGGGGSEAAQLRAEVARLQGELQAARQDLAAGSNERTGLKGRITTLEREAETAKADRIAAEAAAKTAHDTELGKLRGELEQAGTQFEFRAAALAAGVHNADSALKLADLSGVKKGQDGKLTGVAEAVEALRTAQPFLFGEAPKPGSQTGHTQSPGAPPATKPGGPVDARTMSADDWKAARAQYVN